MSQDPSINAMLLDMCAKAQDSAKHADTASTPVTPDPAGSDVIIVDENSNNAPVRESSLPALRSIDDAPGPAKSEDTPQPNVTVAGRNPKDYEWLREALASVESPERQVKRLLDTVEKPDVSKDEMISALEELSDLVEDINWATEFALMGGPKRMLILLQNLDKNGSERFAEGASEVRAALASIVSHSSQQHGRVQQCFADAKWADVIVPMLLKEESPTTLAALLHACSCLCRNFEPNTISFLQHGGMEVLTSLLQRKRQPRIVGDPIDNKILGRIFFFVAYLASTGVSSEKIIKLTCEHVERSGDKNNENYGVESMQRSAAMALFELTKKSPSLVKRLVRECMAKQFQAWRQLNVCAEDEDPRRALTDELEKLG
ncbi:unnamed protein product [Phytomonas sp. EM1]|nr:unnamed protein product [Phytomonas sp. EM1]|eukprot:CCW60556.1 unnamed protein product [Phytomonas sp. isolate EM1]